MGTESDEGGYQDRPMIDRRMPSHEKTGRDIGALERKKAESLNLKGGEIYNY